MGGFHSPLWILGISSPAAVPSGMPDCVLIAHADPWLHGPRGQGWLLNPGIESTRLVPGGEPSILGPAGEGTIVDAEAC